MIPQSKAFSSLTVSSETRIKFPWADTHHYLTIELSYMASTDLSRPGKWCNALIQHGLASLRTYRWKLREGWFPKAKEGGYQSKSEYQADWSLTAGVSFLHRSLQCHLITEPSDLLVSARCDDNGRDADKPWVCSGGVHTCSACLYWTREYSLLTS